MIYVMLYNKDQKSEIPTDVYKNINVCLEQKNNGGRVVAVDGLVHPCTIQRLSKTFI